MSAAEVEVGKEPDEDVEVEEAPKSRRAKVAKAPVDELLPIIRVGHWVRFAGGEKGVPEHLAGRDGVVTFALVKRAPGGDRLSNGPYEYQDGSEVFLVEARDTREQLSVTRDAFARFDTDQVRLSVA